jgi:16S rRNA processing protein RimM
VPLEVVSSTPLGHERYLVRFDGVSDRAAAEALRGVELRAAPLDLPGVLWVHELVGATVVDGAGSELGRVAAVEANPASDLLVLESGALIPIHFVVRHDAVALLVEVDLPEGLLDL